MYQGVINVYKEAGYTSHDVVARLRGILKQKKIGHTGTLDPAAKGVLPVCLGQATRLCDMLADKPKTYETVMLLGTITDTQDTTGTVLKTCPVTVSEEEVRAAAESFMGDYSQIPPMYSALKVNGKKLYELAREGKEVDRKARPVTILELVITRIELPRVWMRVSCSKGTYIRTLCSDIGEKLGCGGTMESLVRTRVERFFLEEAMTLDEIERARDEDTLADRIVSIEDMFSRYEKAQTIKEADSLVRNGNPLKLSELSWQEGGQTTEKAIIRVCDSSGRFMGIYRFEQERQFYKPWKMFLNAEM
ncbi:MAG: tRNA pseudouridine(55) synthase TruB [Lachnospiraceae bacterium]